jgi:ribose 5-phosphate isomerase B
MVIYLASDHRGFQIKEYVEKLVRSMGYEVVDLNEEFREGDDYPDVASELARKVSLGYENARGILLCGSGVGVSIVANKFKNIRSGLVFNSNQAYDARNDDDINILSLPASYLTKNSVKRIVVTWLETPFSNEERFKRRINKIYQIEKEMIKDVEEK